VRSLLPETASFARMERARWGAVGMLLLVGIAVAPFVTGPRVR
jgi:hypothetical protein